MIETKHEKIGTVGKIKGWIAVVAALGAAVALYWFGEEMKIGPHRELAYAFGGFGLVFALALGFHGTEFGFRAQSLLLCVVCGGIAWLFTTIGLDKGWSLGTGALTFIFGLYALIKLKDLFFGNSEPPEE